MITKKKNLKQCLFIVLMIISFGLENSFSQTKTLPMKFQYQNTDRWCWASSIAMLVNYYQNTSYKDCDILSYYFNKYCCYSPESCYRGGYPNEIDYIINNFIGYYIGKYNRALQFSEIKNKINSGNPIIAWLWNSPTAAHLVVITGYDVNSSSVLVFDPIAGVNWRDYLSFTSNSTTGYWGISYCF